jgi:hypothetical protein
MYIFWGNKKKIFENKFRGPQLSNSLKCRSSAIVFSANSTTPARRRYGTAEDRQDRRKHHPASCRVRRSGPDRPRPRRSRVATPATWQFSGWPVGVRLRLAHTTDSDCRLLAMLQNGRSASSGRRPASLRCAPLGIMLLAILQHGDRPVSRCARLWPLVFGKYACCCWYIVCASTITDADFAGWPVGVRVSTPGSPLHRRCSAHWRTRCGSPVIACVAGCSIACACAAGLCSCYEHGMRRLLSWPGLLPVAPSTKHQTPAPRRWVPQPWPLAPYFLFLVAGKQYVF